MIPITKPFLPPKKLYQKYIDGIWERNWLTNDGPLIKELELELKNYLGVNNALIVSNGTIALQIAIKTLQLQGEIITTPFTYIATATSIVWQNCIPVFVDIDPDNFNINPHLIEAAITKRTSAILATHVFGNPCQVEEIEVIAAQYKLKVIYDAAHAFGVKYKNNSIFNYGDISTTSFHATKLFHTIEGGGVFSKTASILKTMSYLRNFGHDGPAQFAEIGINGKNSEFHAAMGLCNLNFIDEILEKRKSIYQYYQAQLECSEITLQKISPNCLYNHSYFPILLSSQYHLFKVKEMLESQNIYPRRYFYPSLNNINLFERKKLRVSDSISQRILCLPVYHTITIVEQELVVRTILEVLKSQKKLFFLSKW